MTALSDMSKTVRVLGIRLLKSVAYSSPLGRWLLYRYDYMFNPSQLCLLVHTLSRTSGLSGTILEVGVAAGHTTVFLNEHLKSMGDERTYVCLDTFDGFTKSDIDFEESRGKNTDSYHHTFRAYSKGWFDRTMANNGFPQVISFKVDVNDFDFSQVGAVSHCLIDVDLYKPVLRCLKEVLPRMQPGGVIVIDDCVEDHPYDGALQAYSETMAELGVPIEIRQQELGIVEVDEDLIAKIATVFPTPGPAIR